jgi:hypothetical protein
MEHVTTIHQTTVNRPRWRQYFTKKNQQSYRITYFIPITINTITVLSSGGGQPFFDALFVIAMTA